MRNKSAVVAPTHSRPQGTEVPDISLADQQSKVKARNRLQALRIDNGIPVKDMVEVVQALYPKYDKVMQSKCEHGEEYGIQLRADAMRALVVRFAPDRRNAHKASGRSKPYRIQARLTETVYRQLQRIVKSQGATMQDFVEGLILDYITKRKEKSNEKVD